MFQASLQLFIKKRDSETSAAEKTQIKFAIPVPGEGINGTEDIKYNCKCKSKPECSCKGKCKYLRQ